jgi:CheY-like chemotaxis protein
VSRDGLRGLHVLIVDDNATNRRIYEAYTASWGMRPVQADGAASALAQLEHAHQRADPFDVALLDDHMPHCSGLEFARSLRASAMLHHTRVILLTSSGEVVPDASTHGVDFTLSKPVRQSRLLNAISVVMAEPWNRATVIPSSPAAAREPAIAPTGQRILVAEDHPVNWMLVQRLLAKRGHEADHAADGEQALAMLEKRSYQLVLMDCQMPVLDGYSAAAEIRRRQDESGHRHVPVVAMTAHAMEGDRERCLAAGMDDYLAKPITAESLDATLARWLLAPQAKRVAAGDPPVLDPERIAELRRLFPGAETGHVVAELSRDVDDQLRRIVAALAAAQGDAVADAAHRILNSARMVGAAGLAEAASTLESAAHAGDEARAAEAVLSERWEAVRVALRVTGSRSRSVS